MRYCWSLEIWEPDIHFQKSINTLLAVVKLIILGNWNPQVSNTIVNIEDKIRNNK